MKHPSSRTLLSTLAALASEGRGLDVPAVAEARFDAVRADMIVLEPGRTGRLPLISVGERASALLGARQGSEFASSVCASSQRQLGVLLADIAEDSCAVVAGLTAWPGTVHLEMTLAPMAPVGDAEPAALGLLVPLTAAPAPLQRLTLTSWRYLEQSPRHRRRELLKTALVRGVVLYEGRR
jgi:hypothetical protein